MADPYADFPDLAFDRPAEGVLRITLDAPGLNAVGPAVHGYTLAERPSQYLSRRSRV